MATKPGSARAARQRADNDIYTVLMLIAFLFVLAATIYVGYTVFTLFGTILPLPGA